MSQPSRSANGQFEKAKTLKHDNSLICQIVEEEFEEFVTRISAKVRNHYYEKNFDDANLERDIQQAISKCINTSPKPFLKVKRGPNTWNLFYAARCQEERNRLISEKQLNSRGTITHQCL